MTKEMTRVLIAFVAIALLHGTGGYGVQAHADSPTAATNPISNLAGGLNPMNWKMPSFKMPAFKSLLPGQKEKQRIVNKKDGLVNEVTQTASNSWRKTKEVLNPKRLIPTNMFAGNNNSKPAGTADQTPGFFSSLLNGPKQAAPSAEKEEQVATVSDFLGQPKMTR